nr:MAG TPA: hypothetical protein [Caudoviricetes sp.]
MKKTDLSFCYRKSFLSFTSNAYLFASDQHIFSSHTEKARPRG